jgi:hypothetical protein
MLVLAHLILSGLQLPTNSIVGNSPTVQRTSRREAVLTASSALLGVTPVFGASPAAALVKGSSPPPKSGPRERKCKSIDECEALGEAERAKAEAGVDSTIERTIGGDRYRDLIVGNGNKAVSNGDTVSIRYRVMRLGTKARDGLTGEGQTIFSFGYGEDDDKEGDSLAVQLAGNNLVPGVNDALVGMKPGGRRRVLVRPERGWRDKTGACAIGEQSIELKATQRNTATESNLVFRADIGAAIEDEAACQDKTALPQPRTYGQKARFGRRFDESLLVELDLVDFADPNKALGSAAVDTSDPSFRCRQNPFADGCDDGKPIS